MGESSACENSRARKRELFSATPQNSTNPDQTWQRSRFEKRHVKKLWISAAACSATIWGCNCHKRSLRTGTCHPLTMTTPKCQHTPTPLQQPWISWLIISFTSWRFPSFASPHGLTFTWWGCCGLCLWPKPTELAHSFYSVLVSVSVFMALSTVFHSINSPDNSPLSHSVLPGLISAFLVHSAIYLFMKAFFSPDMTLCG